MLSDAGFSETASCMKRESDSGVKARRHPQTRGCKVTGLGGVVNHEGHATTSTHK